MPLGLVAEISGKGKPHVEAREGGSPVLSKQKDFAWSELTTLMVAFGYRMKTTGGSGRKFTHPRGGSIFVIHEPHPGAS